MSKIDFFPVRDLLLLMRPKQWVKNFFVFSPLVFSGFMFNWGFLLNSLFAFLFFCFAASSVYIVNDLGDIEKDRLHPKKKFRPLASGKVSVLQSFFLLAFCYIVILSAFLFNYKVALVLLVYVLINFFYTKILKDIPVVDIFIVAFGFVLRVYAGALAIQVPVSNWMLITVLALSLYLAAVKREQELKNSGHIARASLEKYSSSLVKKYVETSATCAIIFYSMFVLESKPNLVLTIPIILFGIFRYWYIVESSDIGESPTDAVVQDKPILIIVLAWIGLVVYQLYFNI
ncbi:decaprenyl-phosphate phosphoribosyltransferase [Alcaligenes parafaecalis]|uniref:Decaprenyl-phosphate phosphoribosyltransferase n=1 Tax=Alcaligenes parafaecalis TaxID=171260 RepID=A0ABT3VPZ0_9BURK|nr:decaprenyl-phosphate phosphoribosyltransferase [Alcaligenes parafaecalis]MCX5464216.1 decaprenyl-phosphate phosphoribosyltransferase [Alcaligenes parafaecalis]